MTHPDRLGPAHRGEGAPDVTCAAPTCRRRPTHGQLCETDASRLGQWLSDIADDWTRLTAAPAITTWAPDHTGHGGLAAHRSPARLDVIVLRDRRSRERDDTDPDGTNGRGLPEVLHSWAATVRDERGLVLPIQRRTVPLGGRPAGPTCDHWCQHDTCLAWTMRGLIRVRPTVADDRALLATHLDWICGRDWVDEFWTDIRDVWAALKAATGQRTGQRPVRACPAPVGEPPAPCGGPIYLDRDAAYCGACGAAWSGFELVRLVNTGSAA